MQEASKIAFNGIEYIGFYEREFYPLSNFSAFKVEINGILFDTSEAAYHWHKFPDHPDIQNAILSAKSAHEAFKIAERSKMIRTSLWDKHVYLTNIGTSGKALVSTKTGSGMLFKVYTMLKILRRKAMQHEYVTRKLLETEDLLLVEDSWRDDFWGWGPNKDGRNMLGCLWMHVREECRCGVLNENYEKLHCYNPAEKL